MKKITLISIALLCYSISSHAQFSTNSSNTASNANITKSVFYQTDSSQKKTGDNYYLLRSRNQKTAGWCLLGAGTIGLVIGLASFPKNSNILLANEKEVAQSDRAGKVTLISAIVMCSSIPFFIFANSSKRKAKLYMNSEKTTQGIPVNPGSITGLTFSMPISK